MVVHPHHAKSYHDNLVKQLAEHLIRKKFRDVKADHADFPEKPALIAEREPESGHVPDVTAVGIQPVLFEVETDDTIHAPLTRERWELFASYADRNKIDFWIVVPKARKDDARERVETLGLNAKVMGI